MSAIEMDNLNAMIIATIRASGANNSTRNIIITGGGQNSQNAPQQISDNIISNDDYLIASFHYYQPFSFTSSSTENNNDFNWGTVADKNTVNGHFDAVKNWSNSKNIPVTLGEFGADNENGLNYHTGVYGSYGGPINASRVEYHRYLAEQAINRGFSFSAWDAGNKSNKAIHLRTDNPSTNNEISGTWVLDVRDALLSSGTWPLCYGSTEDLIILNPEFECGYNTDWNFIVSGTAAAEFSDADTDSRNGFSGAKVQVNSADIYNKVLLSNRIFTGDLTNKKITIKTYAKSLATSGQSFKIRVKAIVNGNNSFIPSSEFNLTNEYPENPFEFEYIIQDNTSSIQVQVMLGNYQGTYFLDDFETSIESTEPLSYYEEIFKTKKTIYPNPSSRSITIKGIYKEQAYKIYNLIGAEVLKGIINFNENIEIHNLKKGLYFLKLENGNTIKFIKK
jgi:endoglucanase